MSGLRPCFWSVHIRFSVLGQRDLGEGSKRRRRLDSLEAAQGAPKSLQMVTAVMKLKDACSLEEKL